MTNPFWQRLLVRTGAIRFFPTLKRRLRGCEAVAHHFSDRLLAAPLDQLLDDALFPEVSGPNLINLAEAAPRSELPLGALRGLHDRRSDALLGLPALRDHLASEWNVRESILVTQGASGAWSLVLDSFINRGDRVVLTEPCSPLFILGLEHRGAEIVFVPTWSDDGVLRYDMDRLNQAMRGARLVALCDPDNPTGAVFAPEELEPIAHLANKADALIYLDRSFAPYTHEATGADILKLPSAQGRTLIAGSVSQPFGLSAARVGWLSGPRQLIDACTVTAGLSAAMVPPICQHVALAALKGGAHWLRLNRDELAGRRHHLVERLQTLGLEPLWPKGGYFLWLPVMPLGLTGREFSRRLLRDEQVLVQPGDPFGPSGRDHVRISFAGEEGRLREGLNRLTRFVEGVRGRSGAARGSERAVPVA